MEPHIVRPRLLHAMLHVTDMTRSLAFYCDVLGMEVAVDRDNRETGHRNIFLRFPGGDGESMELELTSYRDRSPYVHGDAFGHIALGVDDCRAACAHFADRGVTVQREPRAMPSGAVIAFISDPDGYAIEVIQPAP